MPRIAKPHLVAVRKQSGTEHYVELRENGRRHRVKAHSGFCRCRTKSCEHRNAAERLLAEIQTNTGRAEGVIRATPTQPLTDAVDQYVVACRARGLCESTIIEYRRTLHQFAAYAANAGLRSVQEISERAIVEFCNAYATGKYQLNTSWRAKGGKTCKRRRAPNTVNIAIRNLSAFFSFCASIGLLAHNPVRTVRKAVYAKPVARENIITADEHAILTENLTGMLRDVYVLLYGTGMRIGELAHLRVQDIDLNRQLIHIRCRADWVPKWKVERAIPLSPKIAPECLEILARLIAERVTGHLFGQQLNPESTSKNLTYHFKRLGIIGQFPDRGKITTHILRHTYCSRLLNELHMPTTLVAACTGHRTLSMLSRYCHTTTDNVLAYVAKMERDP